MGPMERTTRKKLPVGGDSWVTVDVYGDPGAPGLVIVPGAMSDAHAWRRVASAITAWPSVAVVNRRGRVPSGPLTGTYSLRTEVDDLGTVLDAFPGTPALFGWSYGGLIALLAADARPLRQVMAYEPVMPPFGSHALPELKAAEESGDRDATVEIVSRKVAGLDAAHVEAMRADPRGWSVLRDLSRPAYAELVALNAAVLPQGVALARRAGHVDLVIGEHSQGTAPYGTSFDTVRHHTPRHATIHTLPGQSHMAHLQAPGQLASLLDTLARETP